MTHSNWVEIMGIVTLTTDLGSKDYYVGAVKGALLSRIPNVTIVDVTHEVPIFQTVHAAFVIRNMYANFPKGTVHIIGVNATAEDIHSFVAVKAKGHYFIGTDNGIFSLIFNEPVEEVVSLRLDIDIDRLSFPTKTVFVEAAARILEDGGIAGLGDSSVQLIQRTQFQAVVEKNMIRGIAAYIDHYGNIITNISKAFFYENKGSRKFTVFFRNDGYNVSTIYDTYKEVSSGEIVVLFNGLGWLEIAINEGSASELLGIYSQDMIRIEFYD